jgi:hypothetical protein
MKIAAYVEPTVTQSRAERKRQILQIRIDQTYLFGRFEIHLKNSTNRKMKE